MKLVRLAERQALRRQARVDRLNIRQEKIERRQIHRKVIKEIGAQLRAGIIARHEDWELGALAPRRFTSPTDANNLFYGTISPDRVRMSIKLRPHEIEERCSWAGGPRFLCLARKDRVVILEGPEKGRISTITSINKENATIELESCLKVQ